MQREAKVITKRVAIEMSHEEKAFYTFAMSRLKQLEIGKRRSLRLMNDMFDAVSDKPAIITKKGQQYFVGSALSKREIAKLDKAKDFVEKYEGHDAIIYTLDDSVAQHISQHVEGTLYIDSRNATDLERLINRQLRSCIPVINISHCLTGIDIHAKAVLWYQTPLSASDDLQGVGRITRLSSRTDIEREVTYLYYNNTLQSDWISELELAYAVNAKMSDKAEDDAKKYPMGLRF